MTTLEELPAARTCPFAPPAPHTTQEPLRQVRLPGDQVAW